MRLNGSAEKSRADESASPLAMATFKKSRRWTVEGMKRGKHFPFMMETRFCGAVAPRWQRIRIRWDAFEPHGIYLPLDPSRLQRIGLLGWMREFEADLTLAQLSLFR